jgi:hypothetical protein
MSGRDDDPSMARTSRRTVNALIASLVTLICLLALLQMFAI